MIVAGHRPLLAMPIAHRPVRDRVLVASLVAMIGLPMLVQLPISAAEVESSTTVVTVESLLADADSSIAGGRLDAAGRLIDEARLHSPGDPRVAAAARRLASLRSGVHPQDEPGLDPQVLVQWARTESQRARERADAMAAGGRYDDAVEQLEVVRHQFALRRLDTDPAVASAITAIDADLLRLRREREAAVQAEARGERQRRLDGQRERTSSDQARTQAVLTERLHRIDTLEQRGHLESALAEARALAAQEPDRPEVTERYQRLLAATHQQRKLSTEQQAEELKLELAERLHRNLIPSGFDGMPIYPEGWTASHPDVRTLSGTTAEEPWRTALRDSLRQRLAIDVVGQNGLEVLTGLGVQSGITLIIDPALAAGAETLVTLQAPSITLENALTWVTRQMNTSWQLSQGAVWVGAPRDDDASTLALYDLSSLTVGTQDQPGPTLTFSEGGGRGGFTDFQQQAAEEAVTPDQIVELITSSVTPRVWTDDRHGITVRGNLIYVQAPAESHRLIGEFIRAQERARNLLVRIETRWLQLTDNDLEEIGVDWSVETSALAFPGVVSAGLSRQNANSTFSGTSVHPLPATSAVQQPPLATQGLKLSVGLLGPTQLSAVLSAASRTEQRRDLVAPSVTTLNGVRSHTFSGVQSAYIADYEVVSNNLDPKIEILFIGNALDIRPLVSADRKYITAEVHPAVTSVVYFTENVRAPRIFGGAQTINGDDDQGFVGPAVDYPLELPNLTVREARTFVTVPDRGSLLMGGFERAAVERAESRIPFIGNIPYLGRLFGKRGRYDTNATLHLLTTMTIISYDEQESTL